MTIIILIFSTIILIALSRLYFLKNNNPEHTIGNLNPSNISSNNFSLNIPLDNALSRITKKPFGLYVSPENSPISPEKFSGYHTGTDFEILESELEKDIQVRAICTGEIVQEKLVSGYGGVIIQKCQFENNPILVLYGHVLVNSSAKEKDILKGDFIVHLSPDNSPQSGFERKHLHLAIIKGDKIDYRGYVQMKNELSRWIDPQIIL